MQIITPRTHVLIEEYALSFDWRGQPGSGFSFPCDKQGRILWKKMPPPARANYADCASGKIDVVALGVKDYSHHYYEDAVGRCDECGTRVTLYDPMTNACPTCGALYNGCGQRLAPRHQWQESWDEDGTRAEGDMTGVFE